MKDIIRFYEEARHRNLLTHQQDKYLHNCIRGYQGEQEVKDWLKGYGRSDWPILENIHLDYYGSCEIDLLLLLPNEWYIFEVKNYNDHFTFENGQSKLGQYALANCPLKQLQRTQIILENFVKRFNPTISVVPVLIFINEHCKVSIDIEPPLEILERSQLRNYIYHIDQQSRHEEYKADDLLFIQKEIRKHTFEVSPVLPPPNDLQWPNFKNGMRCDHCHSFDFHVTRRLLHCRNCEKIYSKRSVICRAIDDYCVVHQSQTFTPLEIYKFLGEVIHLTTISNFVRKNYSLKENYKSTFYTHNKKIPTP